MIFSKIFVVFFALLVGSALAAPVRTAERSLDDLQLSARGFKEIAKAAVIAARVKKHLNPTHNKAVFWSGNRPHPNGKVSAVKDAEHFAKIHGKEVLEPSLQKHGINIPSKEQSPYSYKLWGFASKVYAQRASGEVHAFLGSERREGNIYAAIEKPALMKNNKVTKLIEHNTETGKTTVVKGK